MQRSHIEELRCPACGSSFQIQVESQDQGDVDSGQLACEGCSRSWPILRGVPRLVPEETSREVADSGARFGYEWTTYDDLAGFYEDQFLAWIHPATPEDFQGAKVLDAGCGKGRHMVLAHRFGARRVVGVDVGIAVEAARRNTTDLDGTEVLQGDLLKLPLAGQFDLVYCVGVLHHLPDPREGFRSLAAQLAPGGKIHVWVYSHEGNAWIRLLCDPIRRLALRRLPPFLLKPLAAMVTAPLYGVSVVYRTLARLAPGLHRHLFYAGYLTFLGGLPLRSVFWIVFDQMVAPTTHYIRREQLEAWLAEAGLEDTGVASLRGMSWRAWGQAPRGGSR